MCCGKQRQQMQAPAPVNSGKERRGSNNYIKPKRYSHAYFQYIGKTGIIVQGPVSGMRYRFERYGIVTAVDHRGPAFFSHRTELKAGARPRLTNNQIIGVRVKINLGCALRQTFY